ncbi:hypothetical protein DYQ95_09785 [Xanthomonas sp. LMG 9002]|nr:hypothetical protein [Xanthomonas sp. LMG 9002]
MYVECDFDALISLSNSSSGERLVKRWWLYMASLSMRRLGWYRASLKQVALYWRDRLLRLRVVQSTLHADKREIHLRARAAGQRRRCDLAARVTTAVAIA